MTNTATPATAPAAPALVPAHSHGLLDTVGYDVVRTHQVGARIRVEVTDVVHGGANAFTALHLAQAHRTETTYGYHLPRYADGCREVGHVASRMGVDFLADADA